MPAVPERSDAALELQFLDEDDALIPVGSITALLWEAHSIKPGASNPVLTGSTLPTANPHTLIVDLTAVDRDAVGDRLQFYFKFTYDSVKLGVGAIGRDGPFTLHLENSKISA